MAARRISSLFLRAIGAYFSLSSVLKPTRLVATDSIAQSSQYPSRCHEEERSALLEFKQSLNTTLHCSDQWLYNSCTDLKTLESWKEEINCCEWEGIYCSEQSGRVLSLDLTDSCACGSIDSGSSLHRLAHLQALYLRSVDFRHSAANIPSTVANLSSLLYLDLSRCQLQGELPISIFELPKLQTLDLSNNWDLGGHFPADYYFNGSSSSLEMVWLSKTNFSGELPASIGNLAGSLTGLAILQCNFWGLIPSSVRYLTKLTYLYLDHNHFHGPIPSFASLTLLTTLSLYGNLLTGEIPSSLGNLTQLTDLDLSSNQLTGPIPHSIGNLKQLRNYLYLGSNKLTGPIPSQLGNLTRLSELDLSSNHLTGPIPSSLTNLHLLVRLHLFSNRLTGPIPHSIDNLKLLNSLHLDSNKLTGPLPSQLGNLTHLQDLGLSSNGFSGSFPDNLTRLTNVLAFLDLSTNNLNGTLGFDRFLHFKNLRILSLSFNELSVVFEPNVNVRRRRNKFLLLSLASCNISEFPQFLIGQNKLLSLDLSYNNISGRIPTWFLSATSGSLLTLNLSGNSMIGLLQRPVPSNLTTIRVLDLSSNKLQGSLPIPPSSALEVYLVSNNRLSGELPPSLCNLTTIRRLDLAKNDLTGVIPQCLTELTSNSLSMLTLRGNNLYGTIPDQLDSNNRSCNLRMMNVSDNQLQGPLPRSLLSSCTELEYLNVGNNSIVDNFPSWLGSLANLSVLILRSNRFHGVIDDQEPEDGDHTDQFPRLQVVDISHNNFNGFLPSKYFQSWIAMRVVSNEDGAQYIGESETPFIFIFQTPESVQFDYSMTITNKGMEMMYAKILNYFISIDLSGNNFSGEISESIANLEGLRLLNLSHNILTGHIPPFLKDLKNLEALDLSGNKLSGEIPQQLTQLTSLSFFNVSYNRLLGHIPREKQFNTFQNDSYIGNVGLCGDPLPKECGSPDQARRTSPSQEAKEGSYLELEWPIILMGVASGLVVGVIMGQLVPLKQNNWFVRKISQIVRRRLAC